MSGKTRFLTRKKDKRVFPLNGKVARDSGNPSYVGVDKSQVKYLPIPKYSSPRGYEDEGISDNLGKPANFKYSKKFLKDWYKDSDADGVPNSKDCAPYNPKKQGKLHDIAVKLLRQREQKLENERLKEVRKLEETKERLREQQAIESEKNAKLQQKQAIINEINAEKQKIEDLKRANQEAKKKIFDASPTGKAVKLSSSAIKRTQEYLNKPKTKKVIKKLFG